MSAVEDEATRWVRGWARVANLGPDEVRRHTGEWAERLAGHRRELESFMEDGIQKALDHLRMPKREQIEALDHRLKALSDRVEKLSGPAPSRGHA